MKQDCAFLIFVTLAVVCARGAETVIRPCQVFCVAPCNATEEGVPKSSIEAYRMFRGIVFKGKVVGKPFGLCGATHTVRVLEALKRCTGENSFKISTLCSGSSLKTGKRYLIFGSRGEKGNLFLDLCYHARPWSEVRFEIGVTRFFRRKSRNLNCTTTV
mmetsp:Transcript_12003/g.24439  ORF Transcript_12003/g.24439 Transcript_12003/m.24439 type:complete len:159 (+) Transcript_12003:128-604(+)